MRTNSRPLGRAAAATATATAVLAAVALAAMWPAQARAADTLRPELAKPLNAAQELYRARKYKDALAKLDAAAAVANKTPYEVSVIEQMRGAAAMAAGDNATAARAYESLLSGGRLSGQDEARIDAVLAGIEFQQRDYAHAIATGQRYLKAGGNDPQMRLLLAQAYYQSNDFGGVVRTLKPAIDGMVRAGQAPDEGQLQLLGTSAQRAKDDAAYRSALEALVAYHSKPVYWNDLFAAIRAKPGYSSRLDLDLYRLRRATGSLATAEDYMEMTQLALVAGTPAEAKQVIDKGFAAGVLGRDAQAEREKRLQALAARRAAAPDDGAQPVSAIDQAFNRVFAGQTADGIAAMQAAIAKGGLDHADEARLHLGIAYYLGGQKARAQQAFNAVKGTDGAADLARLWLLVASK
ncbi:hypothetical protein F7R21_27890 [Burkholderia latens]|uniref:Tetratricopeptide repeat family protein n=2 Tax=Burkholderia latens TaxID=488446 RepID=A0A6H9T3Q1_9BURK|nr:hypothetical protein F7R21_27890 [Burkholderia latens]VWB26656.1 tetratricopeptide repeat family protein [Burkholderia latens]